MTAGFSAAELALCDTASDETPLITVSKETSSGGRRSSHAPRYDTRSTRPTSCLTAELDVAPKSESGATALV